MLFTASASGARGNADGSDVTWTNTHVNAGDQVVMTSGGDTIVKGAVVKAPQITANVGGNLNVESLQDTSKFDSKQQSIGGSVSFGYGKWGGSFSASNSKVDSDFASVVEQSGFRAGDKGFNVNVAKNTNLKGGAVTSAQKAIDDNKNNFSTGGDLTTSDIQNQASYKASSFGVSAGSGGASSAGFGSDSGSASSTTMAAISGIAGNKGARTGDAESGIHKIFDADKVQKDIDAQVQITQTFGREASKAIGDYASTKQKEAVALRTQAKEETDPERAAQLRAQADQLDANWGDKGSLRLAAHTLIGALTGGVQGAMGSAAGTLTAPTVAETLKQAGVDPSLAKVLTAIASTTAGAALGGTAGATTALNEVTNNYLKHADVIALASKLSKCKADDKACKADVVKEAKERSDKNDKELLDCATDQKCVEKHITDYVKGDLSFSKLNDADEGKGKQAFGEMSNMEVKGGLIAANLSAGNKEITQWKAAHCGGLADAGAACEKKFQQAAANGDMLNKKLDGGLLEGSLLLWPFNSSHQYNHIGKVCDGATPGCTVSSAFEALLRFPGPGSSGAKPVENGDISDIQLMRTRLGYVTHLVDPETKAIVNITLPGRHGLDPGWVVRQVQVQPNGVYINSYGAGTGSNPWNMNVRNVDRVWGNNVDEFIKPAANSKQKNK